MVPSSPPRNTQGGGDKVATVVQDGSNPEDCTMRSAEGEAAPPPLDDDHNTKDEPPSKDPKKEGKEEAMDTDDHDMDTSSNDIPSLPPRPFPRRPGWGRHPDEEFFHTVPPSHGGSHKKRAIFRLWPRDPKGKVLMPSEQPRGTLSPDGYPWGATLYDFFHVSRMPDNPCAMTVMTGSALTEAMEELGELDVAGPEIEWANSEGEPRLEAVANTELFIRCIEDVVERGIHHKSSMLDDVRNAACSACDPDEENAENPEDSHEVGYGCRLEVEPPFIPPPPTIPATSPFHPSHYPKPWPFIPFKGPKSIPLREQIPLCLLPQTLYVHDPFSLLHVCERRIHDTTWMSRPDIIQTYNLTLSESVCKGIEEARRKAEELEEFKARTLIILRYERTKEQIENHEPVIEVPLPPYPRRMTKVEESHLYLSPVAKAGQGHHSIVYKGEWELPRDLFARPKLCQGCFEESVDKEIRRLKDTGRWEKMLRAAAWGPTGSTGHQPTQAELDEVNDPIHLDRDGEIIEREITCVVPHNTPPSRISEIVEEGNVYGVMKLRNANAIHLDFTKLCGRERESTEDSRVPTLRINLPFSYENQKTCTHGSRSFPIPRTAKFTVVAKLSFEYDRHLAREASNYQKFPKHFFHHYNGYTLVSQLHTIVPVNAVVPQFYGYYTPEMNGRENRWESYLSPILLLEHCGEPIDPEELSVEDQEECASLLLRFQRAKWLHESVAPRNFLVQPGKPTEFPDVKQSNPELSFRLIDFGRSRKFDQAGEKRAEEIQALRMFEKLNGQMSVTFSI